VACAPTGQRLAAGWVARKWMREATLGRAVRARAWAAEPAARAREGAPGGTMAEEPLGDRGMPVSAVVAGEEALAAQAATAA
jgi:hypothetical protein